MDEALRQIGNGLTNLNNAFIAHQANSERRWSLVDQKIDRVYGKLSEVCDKGGKEHDGFDARLQAIETWKTSQEARNQGRADIIKPIISWAGRNAGYILLAAYVGWTQFAVPLMANATAQPVQIHGRLSTN